MSEDYGRPIHYTSVQRGTPVYDSEGVAVGEVRRVEDNYAEHILDGFEVLDREGTLRFVDAPEVARITLRQVTLTIDASEVSTLPEHRGKLGAMETNLKRSGRRWKRRLGG